MNTRLEHQGRPAQGEETSRPLPSSIQRWQKKGLAGLWSARGRGAKAKWKAEDLEYIETCLNEEKRTYNSIQLARKLREERAVNLSSDRLRKILKKKDIVGRELGKAIVKSDRQQLKKIKRADLEMLKIAAMEGDID